MYILLILGSMIIGVVSFYMKAMHYYYQENVFDSMMAMNFLNLIFWTIVIICKQQSLYKQAAKTKPTK